MSQSVKDYVISKAQELISIPSCCAEAKEAAQGWLDAIGTDKETEMAEKMFAELEEDITPIDGLIAFAESEKAAEIFGENGAKELAASAREHKAAGGKNCNCVACAAVEAILEKKNELL